MVHPSSNDSQSPSSAVPAHLIETGMELVRAEVAVAFARARQAMLRAFIALLATILAAALLQVALVLVILFPLLVRTLPAEQVWMAIALPSLLALASLLAAALAWRGTRRSLRQNSPEASVVADAGPAKAPPAIGPLSQGRVEQ